MRKDTAQNVGDFPIFSKMNGCAKLARKSAAGG